MPTDCSLDLVGAAEIAEMLGGTKPLSRQRITQLTKHPKFPQPALRLKMGAIWWADDVREWAAEHPRRAPGNPQPTGQEDKA